MRLVSVDTCFEHAENIRGRIVLITGGASGFGSALALECSRFGANVVIADVNAAALQKTIKQCEAVGGVCITPPSLTNVVSLEAQDAMFRFVKDTYARPPDIVVVNAGVSAPDMQEEEIDMQDLSSSQSYPAPNKPATFEINLQGAVTTATLAQQYWADVPARNGFKRKLILVGSLSGFSGIPLGSTYTMSKHCLMGYWKSLSDMTPSKGFECHLIAPYFSPTPILKKEILLLLSGYDTVRPDSVARTMFLAASAPASSVGNAYCLLDSGGPVQLSSEEYSPLDSQMVAELEDFVMAGDHPASHVPPTWSAVGKDVSRLLNKPLYIFAVLPVAALAVSSGLLYATVAIINKLPPSVAATVAVTGAGFSTFYARLRGSKAKTHR